MTSEPSSRVWTWRDAGRHGPLIRGANLLGRLAGYTRKRFVAAAFEEAAARQTGLSDFGEPSYREGLEVLCRAYDEERHLTALGQFAARHMLTDALARRLRLIDWAKQHPRVGDEAIVAPWIITGLPRSGTTLSSALMNLDPQVRTPLVWEVEEPLPPPTLASYITDARIARSIKRQRHFDKLVPSMKAIHPMEASYPQECVVITQMDFKSVLFQAFSPAPSYVDWYEHCDMEPAYRMHKLQWQTWQSTIPCTHWASKAPNHMQGIDALMRVYPDARVIWSHRDPLLCIPSLVSLFLTFIRTHTSTVDPKQAGRLVNRLYFTGLQRMMAHDAQRQARGERWCYHLYYDALLRDPVAALSGAYTCFGETMDALHERRIRAWLAQRPQNHWGVHRYTLEDFGLDAGKLRDQYAEYVARYQVPLEYQA